MWENMKLYLTVLLLTFCCAECRKAYAPINKNANIDFINMEGGGIKPAQNNIHSVPGLATTLKPVLPSSAPVPKPAPVEKPAVPQPNNPPQPVPQPNSSPSKVSPTSPTPNKASSLITPKPVNPVPVSNPITTPGPGSVKSLVNFYDSQGKASPIRPYTYSQAVKQG